MLPEVFENIPPGFEHIGWQSKNHERDSIDAFVHSHYFDDWSDEVIAFHVNCNPVFVRKVHFDGADGGE